MKTPKSLLDAAIGVVLAVVLLPVFVWLGLAALGASVAAILIGTFVAAWQLRQTNQTIQHN